MKNAFFLLISLFSISAFAFSNAEIAELYNAGQLTEKPLLEVSIENPEAIMRKLELTASEVADIWSDSILEGPFELTGPALLNKKAVKALFYQAQHVGFSAEVKAAAIYVEENQAGEIVHSFIANAQGDWVYEYYVAEEFRP